MSSSSEKHDVFLSFRGEDTRSNFTSHLYNALSKKSIRTYIDYQLNRGEDVWPALAKAIEESHVSVVVFSENYASSKWCLEELVKILECRKKVGQVVIPVFYAVDPSHIRKQSGSYEKAFAKHERDLGGKSSRSHKQKVFSWKAALTEAANISGWDSRTHRDESQTIENVVNDVLQKLHLKYPTELKGLVGTEKNCKKVELLLKKVRVIGIWGMGGIGKSTIAKVLFAKLFPQYDNVCFVANSKECSPDKLFFALLKEEVSTSNVVGSTFDMRRLSSKKVFIVLDGMDSLDSLEYLCREFRDLDRESRLIITTRNRQLLVGKVDWIYKVKKWKNPESLKLFCLEAFKKRHPQRGYENLSTSAVKYAGGVPLALKVLGSYFHSKSIDFCESTLRKLDQYPNEKIQNVLKVSYNGLDDLERNIFLDIAYFFKEKRKDHVISVLDACGFEATSGIEVLEDKTLITISNSNMIQMHDLLQQMGLEIVRQECSAEPGRRSRLKDNEAREVIEKNKGTDAIQGIALDLSQIKDLLLHANSFTKMKTLRFLIFYNTLGQSSSNTYLDLPETLEPFSDKLRYIEWIGYPFESLPSPFCAKLLVEIHMPRSKVKQLWQEIQELDNLEGIDLSECFQFEELPDLSKAPKLKWVNLSCCESLRHLHPSVLSSDTLVSLMLDGCTKLESVKGEKHLKCLKEISVNGCINLVAFAVSSDLIENLDLSNTGILTLDTSIGRMHKLKWLNLEGLRLGHPLKELSCLTSLRELKLSDSGLVIDKEQLQVLFDGLSSLIILHMKDMRNLFELPDNISVLSKLYELKLDRSKVKSLPESIKNLGDLEILSLENCEELLCLPTLPSRIKYLGAINCTQLASVSNLNTLATEMWGMTKFITFKNSLKLDGLALKLITESLLLTMMSAAFHNVLVRRLDDEEDHSYNYTSVELCLPGSRVPPQLTYRATMSSIDVELPKCSNLLGFIYSVLLSPAAGMNSYVGHIICECRSLKTGAVLLTWHAYRHIGVLNSDHVYVWYDPFNSDSILHRYEPKVCFEFSVANKEGKIDGSVCVKACGIRFISVSDAQSVLGKLDLDSVKKKHLEDGVEWETRQKITISSIQPSHKAATTGTIGNQLRDRELSEHSSSDSILGTESDTEMIESESAEEGNGREIHYSDGEESIKTDSGTDCSQNTRDSTNAGKYEGNKGTPIKPDATLHETVESQSDKENESEEKSRPKSVMDELELVEDNERKDNFSGVEESIGYTRKEIKTVATRSRESITEDVQSKIVQLVDTPAEPDASLHDPIESQLNTEYCELEDESITQSKLVVMVELESANGSKDYFYGVEESIESARKETQTTARRGLKENSTQVVQSKGNNGTQAEPSAILYEPVESQPDKENASEDNSSEELYLESKLMIVEVELAKENGNKERFSNVQESIRSTRKDNTTKSTEIVKSKGNNGTPTNPDIDARLHEHAESQSNKEKESNEKSITEPKSMVIETKSCEEHRGSADYFSDVEEKIKSTRKDTKTGARRGHKESTTTSTKYAKSKGNELGTRTESDGEFHLPMVSVNEENASNSENIEEAKYSEENENLQGGEIIVDSEIIHDLNVVEEPNHEKENKGEDGSDEDPFAELESILLRSPKSSAKATSSTTVAIREALHNLHYLLENSLESILNDTELQQQLHVSLECIGEASISPNVAKLVEGMTSSIDDLFKDFASTQKVVQDHTSCLQQKEKFVQQLRDAKKRQELVNKEVNQCKFETERLDKEAEKLDEKIRLFVEQKKSIELRKAKLKETLERCEGEKKKLKHEAKNKVTESKEIVLAFENSKALYDAAQWKQQKLNDKWEGFRTAFADNCGTLVAHDTWWHKPLFFIFLFFIFNIFLCYEGPQVDLHSE